MTNETGRVIAVNRITLGDQLAQAAAVGATTLYVNDAADFSEDGGSLLLNGDVLTYSYADLEEDTIILAAPLAVAAAEDDRVDLWDPTAGAACTEYMAHVTADGEDWNDDAMECVVDHSLIPFLPEGIRDAEGEAVELAWDGDDLKVVNILGQTPAISDTLIRTATSGERAEIGPSPLVVGGHEMRFYSGAPEEIDPGMVNRYMSGVEHLRIKGVERTDSATGMILIVNQTPLSSDYGKIMLKTQGKIQLDAPKIEVLGDLVQPNITTPYMFRYRTANQSIATSTWTGVALGTGAIRGLSTVDSISFQIERDGVHTLNANVNFDSNPTGYRAMRIRRNGVDLAATRALPPGSGFCGLNISCVAQLVAGDQITIEVWQNSGAALALAGTLSDCNFSIGYLGE